MTDHREAGPQSPEEFSEQSVMLETLAKQVRQNFYVLKNLMMREGVFDDLGRWGSIILGILCRGEPCSIPALQADLPLSRQYIQKEIGKLQAAKLIETVPNPAHKSSKLLKATAQGKRDYQARRALYMAVYSRAEDEFSVEELRVASQLMEKLERVFSEN